MDIHLRGELWDNDSADILRWCGWRDLTCPGDIAAALEQAGGEDVTILINSPGGDMTVGAEIRSMFRRYEGKTTALFQGYGASSATLAASGCTEITSEPGALLCYHNPISGAQGDYQALGRTADSLRNARDCILEMYTARKSSRSKEELAALMDQNIFISPTQALEYGLLDKIVPLDGAAEDDDPAAFVAASASRMRITKAMREQYQSHVAAQRDAEKDEARRALAHLQALATF